MIEPKAVNKILLIRCHNQGLSYPEYTVCKKGPPPLEDSARVLAARKWYRTTGSTLYIIKLGYIIGNEFTS